MSNELPDKTIPTDTDRVSVEPDVHKDKDIREEGFTVVVGEYGFVALPLLVIMFIFSATGKTSREIFASPEWSFASSILMGQLIVKSVSAALRLKSKSWRFVSGLVSFLIITGLVPSLLTLTMILILGKTSSYLITAQLYLFVMASALFIGLGGNLESVLIGREADREQPRI